MSLNASGILVVEDDADQADLFSLILAKDGHTIFTTANAEAALARLAEDPPVALLLADWDLPGMKGDALIRAVKSQYPALKTVLFSNHVHVNEAAAACGADGWFRKMDEAGQLRRLIAGLLSHA